MDIRPQITLHGVHQQAEEAARAGIADVGRAGMDLLRHRSDEASELVDIAGDDRRRVTAANTIVGNVVLQQRPISPGS